MRTLFVTFLLATGAHAAPPAPLAAYVAEPLAWTNHWNEPCDPDGGCLGQPDTRQVHLRVDETLRGPDRRGELDVTLTPDVDLEAVEARHVLLVGRWGEDGTFAPVAVHPVDALRDGGWGVCARYAYFVDLEDTEQPKPEPLEFVDDFGDASRYTAHGRLEQFDPLDFAIEGNRVRCRRGIRVGEVVKVRAGEPLAAQMTRADVDAENATRDAAMGAAEPEPDSQQALHRARRKAREDAARGQGMKVVMANPHGDVLWAFVGEQISFHDTEAQCGPGCWQFDSVYSARYRPRQVFDDAELGTAPVQFSVWTHYGYPEFARTPTALLFVWARPDGLQLAKYQAMSVDRTADGRWAFCGDPYDHDNAPPAGTPRTVPLRFADDVVFDDVSRWSAQHVAEAYPADVYAIVGGKVHCTRGAYAEDIARYVGAAIRKQAEEERAMPATPESD
jgi:hypothetical protein